MEKWKRERPGWHSYGRVEILPDREPIPFTLEDIEDYFQSLPSSIRWLVTKAADKRMEELTSMKLNPNRKEVLAKELGFIDFFGLKEKWYFSNYKRE